MISMRIGHAVNFRAASLGQGDNAMKLKPIIAIGLPAMFFLGVTGCTTAPEPLEEETPVANEVVNAAPHVARAFGAVLQRDLNTRILEITHTPVPDADWPIMQMEFYVSNEIDLANYRQGDAVEFIFNYAVEQTPVIIAMRRTSPQELIGAMWPEALQDEETEPQ